MISRMNGGAAGLLVATLVLHLVPGAARAADARRATPPVAAAADVADWRSAQLGRAALPKETAGPDGLLVVTGGAFASAGVAPQEAAARTTALVDAAGFDVVNLAHRDLATDPAALAAAVGGAKAKYVSASFSLAGAATPWKSHAVVERGGKRIAVVGVAVKSAYEKLDGLQYVEPRAALEKAIADAGNVDAVVVLSDAPLSEAAAWQNEIKSIDAVILSGRGGGAPAVEKLPRVLRAPPGGQALGVLPSDTAKAAFAVSLPALAVPSDAYQQVASRYTIEPKPLKITGGKPLPPPPPPTTLEANRLTPLGIEASNRAAVATLRSAGLFDAFAGKAAPAGRKYLVLDLTFRNILSPQMVRDKLVPVTYLIPKLSDHLYLVADGRAVLQPTRVDAAGMLSTDALKLPRAGSTEGGKLVYEVDAANPPRELTLRMYDYAHGHFVLPVLARGSDAPKTTEQPVSPLAKNEVVEIGAYDLKKLAEYDGQRAPTGMTFVSLDLRARSLFTYEADATAFDPKARPGQKTRVGTVADWKEAHRYCQLVVDGERACVPFVPGTQLSDAPRFLPDVATGGRVVFLAPVDAKSLELRCDFPNARPPSGQVIRPKGVTLALGGTRPQLADIAKPIAQISDDVYRVAVTGQQVVESFAGQKPSAGGQLIVLDVTVKNVGGKGEFFQTKEQLKYAAEDGSQSPLSSATYAGPYRPTDLVWIPPGERRSFQAVFETRAGDKRPRLAFTGVSLAKTVDLKPVDGAKTTVAAGEPAKQPVTPATPAKQPEMKQPEKVAVAKADAPTPPVQTKPLQANKAEKALRVTAKQPHKPKGLAGVGLTPEQVNQSIDRGADSLWNLLKKEIQESGRPLGTRGGYHILPTLALVHAGAHKRHPDFDQALRGYLDRVKPLEDVRQVYDAGLFCMLIEAYGDASYVPKMRECARWLLENQGKDGTWGYGTSVDPAVFKKPVSDKVLQVSGGRPTEGPGSEDEAWTRMTPWEKGDDGDTSVTQYALLGLHSSGKSVGIKFAADTWQRTLAEHAKRQCDDGGWNYHVKNTWSYGSMTAAGVCARALARHALGEKNPAEDESIERGLAWLVANFKVTENPPQQSWHYYYLYALERVGRILDTEFIGPYEWYPLGAKEIVANQKADGSWAGIGQEAPPDIAGSFALLFLTRATASLDAKPKRGGPGLVRTNLAVGPSLKLHVILDCSGSMLEEIDGRTKFASAKAAVAALIKELPDNAEVGLRAYGHRKRAIEPGASEDTQLVIPVGKLDRDAFLAKLEDLRAKGKTPLAQSLTEAARDVAGGTEENPVTVVLLTDGGEDSQPRKDPLKAADAMGAVKGAKLQIVGFDINREDWTQQLQEMAKRAGGMYLTAAKPEALMPELRSAVYRTPSGFSILDKGGREVARGAFGDSAKLQEGQYKLRTVFAGQQFEEAFWVNTDSVTGVTFDATKVTPGAGTPVADQPAAQQPAAQPGRPMAPAAGPKFCTSCGAALKPDAKFCTNCGAKVVK